MNSVLENLVITAEKEVELLASARRVFTAEALALQHMAEVVDKDFAKAVTLLVGCKGRVVVSGMGKSGHIARKIAATLASTGTPALFVHPGEASHGDMGMVTQSDVIILISNSGEAPELSDLIAYTRRFDIPMIAITGREKSTLAQASDFKLILPPDNEVCPMGLAPTTSTTMTLAMGDALAVATLESKGFTADDYRNFHPGGKLGKRLMRVASVMHGEDELPLAKPSDKMSDVLVMMTKKTFGCAGIVDDAGKLLGIITDGDLRRHMGDGFTQKTAADVMTANPMVFDPSMLAAEALRILNEKKRTQVFVVEGDKLVGVLHIHDLLRAGIA